MISYNTQKKSSKSEEEAFNQLRRYGVLDKFLESATSLPEYQKEVQDVAKLVEEAKANVRTLIETAKKEAIMLSEKIAVDANAEIENLEKAMHDKAKIEERQMQRAIVNEVLDELFKEGSVSLDENEMVNIINKKVA